MERSSIIVLHFFLRSLVFRAVLAVLCQKGESLPVSPLVLRHTKQASHLNDLVVPIIALPVCASPEERLGDRQANQGVIWHELICSEEVDYQSVHESHHGNGCLY